MLSDVGQAMIASGKEPDVYRDYEVFYKLDYFNYLAS